MQLWVGKRNTVLDYHDRVHHALVHRRSGGSTFVSKYVTFLDNAYYTDNGKGSVVTTLRTDIPVLVLYNTIHTEYCT